MQDENRQSERNTYFFVSIDSCLQMFASGDEVLQMSMRMYMAKKPQVRRDGISDEYFLTNVLEGYENRM